MAENTKIQWCQSTFNPWRGCTKVAPGCVNCYADAQSRRNPKVLGVWGPNGTRVVAADEQWHQVARWNDAAKRQGVRQRVFVASLADVFEDWPGVMHSHTGELLYTKNQDSYAHSDGATAFTRPDDWRCVPSGVRQLSMDDVRARLFRLIDACPHLDFLLVTKRPENVRKFWPTEDDGAGGKLAEAIFGHRGRLVRRRENVWLLTSVSDQATADAMVPQLLECRDLCPVLGISAEPLICPIDLSEWIAQLDWVIVGGESGPGARPCRVEWIRDIVRQCRDAGVPCFVKQLGAVIHATDAIDPVDQFPVPFGHKGDGRNFGTVDRNTAWIKLADPKGGDWSEWPFDLRVRQFPEVAR